MFQVELLISLVKKYKAYFALILFGAVICILGLMTSQKLGQLNQPKIEILDASGDSKTQVLNEIVVEIAGEVQKPGVYKLISGQRVEDILTLAGGFSANADRVWIDRNLNRAAKLTDGQKIYLPSYSEQTSSLSASNEGSDQSVSGVLGSQMTSLVNINSASLSELDSLPGIGQVYGQSIIDHRPYSTTQELLSKGVLKSSVYKKIEDKITAY